MNGHSGLAGRRATASLTRTSVAFAQPQGKSLFQLNFRTAPSGFLSHPEPILQVWDMKAAGSRTPTLDGAVMRQKSLGRHVELQLIQRIGCWLRKTYASLRNLSQI
jgi:hypothetical protein